MLALQAGTYRWLSGGDILKTRRAARVEALGEGHQHVAKEQLLNASLDHPPSRAAGRSLVQLQYLAAGFQRARGRLCHPGVVCREV